MIKFPPPMIKPKKASAWAWIPTLYFAEGLPYVELNNTYGFIDKSSIEVIPFIYDGVGNFNEGLARVNKDGKWGFIDTHGALVIDYLYTQVGSFCDGYAPIAQDFGGVLRWGIIDLKGEIVIPFEYDYIYPIRKE